MALTEDEKKELIKNYSKKVAVFNKIGPEDADKLLEEKAGHIIYIGRNNCPFCQKFVNKLSPLAEEKNLTVNYVDSKNFEYKEALENFREKYKIATVPGLLYSSETAGLIVKCDSSLTPEEILTIVEAK